MLRQVTGLEALEGTDVPHCRVRWRGGPDDLESLGRPYFVVEQLGDGVVGMGGGAGWVADLTAAQRTKMGRQAMDALAGIHPVDWQARCGYLGEAVSLADDVTRWDRFVAKAADPDALGDVPALRQLLLERMPGSAHVGLFHGDLHSPTCGARRLASCALDWELWGMGPRSTTSDG